MSDLRLDHLVINTHFGIDAAVSVFENLGFQVTPRGYHTLGSVNHTIVFADHYLELIGLPADGKIVREDILASPLGADGLVFRIEPFDDTQAPEAIFAALGDAGFEASAPQVFSRPVEALGEARFATVRLRPGQLGGGRVYFCQHLTPELVFRAEWQHHRNGAHALARLHLVDVDAGPYERLARIGKLAAGFDLAFWTRAAFAERFGELAQQVPSGVGRYAAITVRTPRWQALGATATALGLPTLSRAAATVVALPNLDTLLEFIA
jgi:hypothetical protein